MKELRYLLILVKLWPGDWEDQLERLSNKVDEENGIGKSKENEQFRKLRWFSRNKFWKNIACILSVPTFGLGGSRLWEKDIKISGKNTKRSSIQSKVDLYEVCASLFKIIYLFIYSFFYTNTYFTYSRFVESLALGESNLGSICQVALI